MSGCTKWYHVRKGNTIDEVFENKIQAKKHAAWLHETCGRPDQWYNRISLSLQHDLIPFDDYEFKNGESRKVSKK
jgi:hypothetical protein